MVSSADDLAVAGPESPELVGMAGDRFAVFDTSEMALVLDAESRSAFGVYGHPLRTTNADRQTGVATSADGTRMLVRTEHGIQAVDLAARGAFLSGWRGHVSGASIAADGQTFAAWSDEEITVVRIADGAHVVYPISAAAHEGAAIATSKDGSVMVVYRDALRDENGVATAPGVVEVWRPGETRPVSRIASAFVSNLRTDAAGTEVAWVEHDGSDRRPAQLHALDVTSGVHIRFAAKPTHGSIAPEVDAKAELVLVDGTAGVELVDVASGAAQVKLEGSAAFAASSSHFWGKSGARIVAISGESIAVWDGATGKRVWAMPR